MCTGMEIAAMAALAGGTYLQHDAQRSAQKAQERKAMEELARQQQYDQDKARRYDESLNEFSRESQDANLEDATNERRDLFAQVTARPEDGDGHFSEATGEQASGPRVVQSHAERRRREADDFVSLMGDARARLGAWGGAMFRPGQELVDLGFDLNQLGGAQGRSARIGQFEAQQAGQNTGNRRALAGNVLAGLGSAGMGYAGTQATPSPANYQGPGFGGVSGSFSQDYGSLSGLGSHFYRPGGGRY